MLEFKRALPVHYQSLSNLSWSSARDFCQRKKSDLCSSTDICLSGYLGKYPFGDTKSGEQKVPVSDKYGLFVNIGKEGCLCKCTNVKILNYVL